MSLPLLQKSGNGYVTISRNAEVDYILELALDEGNYDKAIAEYETLPEPSKAAGAEFMARVRARNEADQLVARLMADALAAS